MGYTPKYIWNIPTCIWDYRGYVWIMNHLLSGMRIQIVIPDWETMKKFAEWLD